MANRSTFPSVTGQALEKMLWEPTGDVRGIVQLAHGMAEHIARYEGVGERLARAGYVVVGHTHLGHGEKAETLGYFADKGGWDALLSDMDALRRETQRAYPGKPYFLLGHSMGSFLARTYFLKHAQGLQGLILSGTGHYPQGIVSAGLLLARLQCAFGMAKKPSKLLSQMSFGANNKSVSNPRTGYDWLSTVPSEVDAYIADPYCGFDFTAGGFRDLFLGLKRLSPKRVKAALQGDSAAKKVPIWLFSGAEDPVGDGGKGVEITAQELRDAGVQEVTVTLFPGCRHEMFNETDRDEVLERLVAWLDRHIGARG